MDVATCFSWRAASLILNVPKLILSFSAWCKCNCNSVSPLYNSPCFKSGDPSCTHPSLLDRAPRDWTKLGKPDTQHTKFQDFITWSALKFCILDTWFVSLCTLNCHSLEYLTHKRWVVSICLLNVFSTA